MARDGKILVVTPTLGASAWLAETVASVARHAPLCTHVLVAPAAVLPELAVRFPQTQWVAERGEGMYAAINAGLAAGGDWDAFTYINDDDLLRPGFTAVLQRADLRRAEVLYGGVELIDTQGKRIGAIPISPWPELNRDLYGQRVEPVYQHGTVITRRAIDQCGAFDPSYRYCGDSELLGRLCLAGIRFVHVTRKPVAAFRLRAGQLTKHLDAMLAEHARMEAKLPLRVARTTLRHRWARLAFRTANLPIYLERIRRHGFITFGELLARGQ